MSEWQDNKRWSDNFLNEIKRALAIHLICEAPAQEDQERNTDLISLKMDSVRVACRIRRETWIGKSKEFTIRVGTPSNVKTELAKIIEGWGDLFFYGFGLNDGSKLISWKIGDLKVFRLTLMRYMLEHKGQLPGEYKTNNDGTSFRVFDWSQFKGMVIGSSEPVSLTGDDADANVVSVSTAVDQ